MKKIIILPLVFFAITVLEIACCNCKDVIQRPYTVLTNGTAIAYANVNVLLQNQTTAIDTINIINKYNADCIAKSTKHFSFFSSALACKCVQSCGESGFKKQLTKIAITATNNFNNIAANQDLSAYCKVKYTQQNSNGINSNTTIPLYQLVDTINIKKYQRILQNIQIKVPKPTSNFSGILKIHYIFGGTDTLQTETVNFNWQ